MTKIIFFLYLSSNFTEINVESSLFAIFWGYKFDFATASFISLAVTLLDFHKKGLVVIGSIFISGVFLAQISDIMYFYESTRHMGYEISDALTDAFGLIMTAISQHTFLTLFTFFSVIIFFFLSFRLFSKILIDITFDKYYFLKKIILILITLFFIRGMFQSIPLNPWQANQIGDSKLAILTINGTYNALYSLANKGKELKPQKLPSLDEKSTKETIKKLYQSKYTPYKTNLKQPNVVIFFLESWSGVNIQSYGFDKSNISPTPFYDGILKQSIRPKAMIAGGHRTTEGIFSSLCSYQNPLGKTIAKTQLQDYHYTSLIDILVKRDYQSAFFQGSSKETSGTGSFVQSIGFKDSYGKTDVKKRIYEENYWGVHDEDLYNFTLEKLALMKKPFVIGINGATTHDDKIPNGIEKIDFLKDEKLNNQLNALHFSDMALRKFVETMKKRYPNTLFVFLADHCGGVKGSNFQNYIIPFAIYHKDLEPKYYDNFISQRDLSPTILDLVFGEYTKYTNNFSGKSLLSDENFFADYYHNGILGWIENNKGMELNTATNTIKCLDMSTFEDKEVTCTQDIEEFKQKALSFTNISQKLLFEGKTKEFQRYKGNNE